MREMPISMVRCPKLQTSTAVPEAEGSVSLSPQPLDAIMSYFHPPPAFTTTLPTVLLELSNGLFPAEFANKILHVFLFPHHGYMPSPS
jgi:hypothetical protein